MRFALIPVLLFVLLLSGCKKTNTLEAELPEDIRITKLSESIYMHTTYLQTKNFGKVGANGLILVDKGEAWLLDTPWNNTQTETVVNWVADSLHAKVSTVIPTHWHEDCMGGLEYLQTKGVESFANSMTIDIAKEKGLPVPQHSFTDSLILKFHDMDIYCHYLGGAHSIDNIVIWIPTQDILFGGCAIKDLQSTNLGNLADADIKAWPSTVRKIKDKFPLAQIIIPGHGEHGDHELLEHTLDLLK